MDENVTVVFHGFLNLTTKEKLSLIKEINNYFDSNDREPIRGDNEAKFKEIDFSARAGGCKCCGRYSSLMQRRRKRDFKRIKAKG